ncbi:MAG: K+ transporter [Parasphingorhabdus sp.]|jgi:K+ transporter
MPEACTGNPLVFIIFIPAMVLFYYLANKWCKQNVVEYKNILHLLNPFTATRFMLKYLFSGPGLIHLVVLVLLFSLLDFTFSPRIDEYLTKYLCS